MKKTPLQEEILALRQIASRHAVQLYLKPPPPVGPYVYEVTQVGETFYAASGAYLYKSLEVARTEALKVGLREVYFLPTSATPPGIRNANSWRFRFSGNLAGSRCGRLYTFVSKEGEVFWRAARFGLVPVTRVDPD